jgi:hypothetical protein
MAISCGRVFAAYPPAIIARRAQAFPCLHSPEVAAAVPFNFCVVGTAELIAPKHDSSVLPRGGSSADAMLRTASRRRVSLA